MAVPKSKANVPIPIFGKSNSKEASNERKRLYRDHAGFVAEEVLRTVLRSFATLEAAVQVQEKLMAELDLDEDVIDLSAMQDLMIKVSKADLALMMVNKSNLSKRHRDLFMDRFIANLIPNTDGPPVRAPNQISRADLENMVRNEARHAQAVTNRNANKLYSNPSPLNAARRK